MSLTLALNPNNSNIFDSFSKYYKSKQFKEQLPALDNPRDKEVDLNKIIGKEYESFWYSRERYRVIKGSRASKKSKVTALFYISNMMEFTEANLVVIRKRLNTHRTSTRNDLIWAINRLGVQKDWNYSTSDSGELTITRISTGQKIFFRGFDDPLNITSFSVGHGILCWAWFEEAFQIESEEDFDKVDKSIRGRMPDGSSLEEHGLWKQITFTFNAWSDKWWGKRRFFDKCPNVNITEDELDEYNAGKRKTINKYASLPKESIFVGTTIYAANEFLDEADIAVFNLTRINNPIAFQIEGLGNWGISEGQIFRNWTVMDFNYKEIIRKSVNINGKTNLKMRFGLDFGYTNDVAALIACIVDEDNKRIWIFDEFYKVGQTNLMLADIIRYKGYSKEVIRCDSAEPKSIDELKYYGITRAVSALKGKDSIRQGIGRLQDYKIIVHPSCENTVIELNNYVWKKDKDTEKLLNEPIDEYNHLMDALRYATEGIRIRTFRF
jgi:phage terminase large subunit